MRATTEGGARALGLAKQIGRIEPGYKADIVFLDLHHINWIPINDPVNQIVHTEDGSAVHSVMIGGRMVVENRKLLTVDLAQARRRGCRLTGAPRSTDRGEARKLYDRLREGGRVLLPRSRQGAAAHPPLRCEPSPSARALSTGARRSSIPLASHYALADAPDRSARAEDYALAIRADGFGSLQAA